MRACCVTRAYDVLFFFLGLVCAVDEADSGFLERQQGQRDLRGLVGDGFGQRIEVDELRELAGVLEDDVDLLRGVHVEQLEVCGLGGDEQLVGGHADAQVEVHGQQLVRAVQLDGDAVLPVARPVLLAHVGELGQQDDLDPDLEAVSGLDVAEGGVQLDELLGLFRDDHLHLHRGRARVREDDLLAVGVVHQADLQVVDGLLDADRQVDAAAAQLDADRGRVREVLEGQLDGGLPLPLLLGDVLDRDPLGRSAGHLEHLAELEVLEDLRLFVLLQVLLVELGPAVAQGALLLREQALGFVLEHPAEGVCDAAGRGEGAFVLQLDEELFVFALEHVSEVYEGAGRDHHRFAVGAGDRHVEHARTRVHGQSGLEVDVELRRELDGQGAGSAGGHFAGRDVVHLEVVLVSLGLPGTRLRWAGS